LELLTPTPYRYTQEEIISFYNYIKIFEENGNKGNSVADAHTNIGNKYEEKHGV
jgi:hypothetical protein